MDGAQILLSEKKKMLAGKKKVEQAPAPQRSTRTSIEKKRASIGEKEDNCLCEIM